MTELSDINRNHMGHLTGLLTRHCLFKGHIFKLGPANSPVCERCHDKEKNILTYCLYVTVRFQLNWDCGTTTGLISQGDAKYAAVCCGASVI
jgi:hypothetical protein